MDSKFKTLSIVIPVYNEKKLLPLVLEQLENLTLPLEKEIVIVDDYSTDGTREYIESLDSNKYKIILKDKNQGKGSALRTGFGHVTGDLVIIQDADLEYDLNDYESLLEPILLGDADVVYGSRFLDMNRFDSHYPLHIINNKMITFVSNIFTGLRLTDMETCYKVIRRDVLDSFVHKLGADRFGIEPEITHHVSKGDWKIIEIPVSYKARTLEEGKKIKMRDGFAALWHIIGFHINSK